MNKFDIFLTTGFYSGYSPFAPGTMGAVVATLMWWGASCVLGYVPLLAVTLAAVVLFTLVSVPSINRVEKVWGEDPSRVVVDEMVGVWIALLAVPECGCWLYMVGAFALFRLFDIWKPLGVRRMEAIGGGWGVMLDDILAGVYAYAVLLIVRLFVGN